MNNSPLNINAENWCYVDPEGLALIHEVHDTTGRHVKTEQIVIPWAIVRHALAQRDKRRRPRGVEAA